MSHLVDNKIDIICFSLQDDHQRRQRLYRLLSDDEKQRAARFRFDKHRHRFIAGRGAIREILASRAGCRPEQIRFDCGHYGKPGISKPEGARGIEFNASSSAEKGAIAISDGIPLGFDIEKLNPEHLLDFDLIVNNEFSSPEQKWYSRYEPCDRVGLFFRFWTCKEAYLKALGVGLSGQLDSFTIDLDGADPAIASTDLEPKGQSKHRLRQFYLDDDYIACLALSGGASRINLSDWWDRAEGVFQSRPDP